MNALRGQNGINWILMDEYEFTGTERVSLRGKARTKIQKHKNT